MVTPSFRSGLRSLVHDAVDRHSSNLDFLALKTCVRNFFKGFRNCPDPDFAGRDFAFADLHFFLEKRHNLSFGRGRDSIRSVFILPYHSHRSLSCSNVGLRSLFPRG
jgi:hypothetical protein